MKVDWNLSPNDGAFAVEAMEKPLPHAILESPSWTNSLHGHSSEEGIFLQHPECAEHRDDIFPTKRRIFNKSVLDHPAQCVRYQTPISRQFSWMENFNLQNIGCGLRPRNAEWTGSGPAFGPGCWGGYMNGSNWIPQLKIFS